MGSAFELLGRYIAAFLGRELKGAPVGLTCGLLEQIVKVIVATRSPDEQSAAFSDGKSRAEHFGPGFPCNGSVLI